MTQATWTEAGRGMIGEAVGNVTIERHSTDETIARIVARRAADRTAAIVAGIVEARERETREHLRRWAIEAATPSAHQWVNAR